MFFGDIFTLLLQSILFWTSRKEIKLIQYKMDQKILWAVNKMPKTDDKNLPIMGLEEIKKARTFHAPSECRKLHGSIQMPLSGEIHGTVSLRTKTLDWYN